MHFLASLWIIELKIWKKKKDAELRLSNVSSRGEKLFSSFFSCFLLSILLEVIDDNSKRSIIREQNVHVEAFLWGLANRIPTTILNARPRTTCFYFTTPWKKQPWRKKEPFFSFLSESQDRFASEWSENNKAKNSSEERQTSLKTRQSCGMMCPRFIGHFNKRRPFTLLLQPFLLPSRLKGAYLGKPLLS